MNTSALNIKGITKSYKNFSLGPIDFQVQKGTAVALVGANGSGKSTFLRIIMQILHPDSGSVELFGRDLQQEETDVKQKVGYVGDMLEPLGHLKIKELSALVSYWFPTWDYDRYSYFLKRYNIDESLKYSKCSKGMKKKVEYIFSMSHDAHLLLLDELSAGLDIISKRKMKEDLMEFLQDGEKSIVLATHSMDEVRYICDYVTVLEGGQIIRSFEKDEVYDKWARLWVSEITDYLENHPNILHLSKNSLQIVTDNQAIIEAELNADQITITHSEKLTIDEAIEYLIYSES